MNLPVFKITYNTGNTTTTSMAEGITLVDAVNYYKNSVNVREDETGREIIEDAISIQQIAPIESEVIKLTERRGF